MSSFVTRSISIRLVKQTVSTLSAEIGGQVFPDTEGSITLTPFDLTGLRSQLIINNDAGLLSMTAMQLRVFGMDKTLMDMFSTYARELIKLRGDQVVISVSENKGPYTTIFSGNISAAFIDYNSAPDVSFNISAISAMEKKVQPAAAIGFSGEIDVASKIESLAKQINYAFEGNGVTAKLYNQYLDGSIVQQIYKLSNAAKLSCLIENEKVTIWPANSNRQLPSILVSPETGMVGYPSFTPVGIMIRTLFNPDLKPGRLVELKSDIVKANGTWIVQVCDHELSTMTPDGPWFTNCTLIQKGLLIG